jgi:signal transduction histidine kinase
MNSNKRLRLAQEKFKDAKIAYDNAHYQQAADLWLESAELYKGLRGHELNYIACLGNAPNALSELGHYNQAKKLLEIALPIKKKIFASDHIEVANSLNNLSIIYNKLEEYEKAKEFGEKALAIRQKFFSFDHPDIAQSLHNLAVIYDALKEYEKAKELHEKALDIREKVLPFDHPDIADSLNNLAITYRKQGEYEKAKELHEKTLAIREKILPSDHPDIAGSLNNLALIYEKQGDTKKAEEYYQRAQNMIKKTFDENHPTSKIISENYLILQQEVEELRKKDIEQRIALEEAKKLSYLGYMATGIAHNINNPVGIIRLAAQNALYSLEQNNTNNETGKEFFDDILIEANRLHEIIQKFRNFTNGDRKHRENVSLNEVVKTIQDYFENQLESHNIKLVFDLSDKNPQSYANDFVLQEVLTNLISNARDAVENISDATIWIKTWEQKNKVGFIVEDNGLGISEEQQPTLFIPFHSTKAHGTGLGLHFAYQSLIDLQGKISYQNRKPNGAHFLIELPTANDKE